MSSEWKASLCGCLTDIAFDDLPDLLVQSGVGLLEWRLDLFLQKHSMERTRDALLHLSLSPRHPVVATNRPTRAKGAFEGPEESRIKLLEEAVKCGAQWVDIEDDTPEDLFDAFPSATCSTLVSHHDFDTTPDSLSLHRLAEKMIRMRPDAIKIVTMANSPEDNLRVLELIPSVQHRFGVPVVAFCMGRFGIWSRAVSVILGSPWTYVRLPGRSASAPGQLSPDEMTKLLNSLTGEGAPDSRAQLGIPLQRE